VIFDRCPGNPILERGDIPDVPPAIVEPSAVLNPGAARHDGRYVLLARVQTRGRLTFFITAESADGEVFRVEPRVVTFRDMERVAGTVHHAYDARITEIEGTYYVMFAMDMDAGCRLGIARTDDFATFDFVGIAGDDDLRDGVLFPERRAGRFLRLERPNRVRLPGGPVTGDEIWLSESRDLVEWRPIRRVMSGRARRWDELIGSGPPPVKTRRGWLHVYHGVATHFGGAPIYQAGAVLLDLDDPARVIGRTTDNVLEPREPYELVGQVPNVVFPTGLIVEEADGEGYARPDSPARLYYGAADTCVCLATTTVERLVEACGR